MNNMFNVIRASFAPTIQGIGANISSIGNAVEEKIVEPDENAPLKKSSVSRGRGVSRNKRN